MKRIQTRNQRLKNILRMRKYRRARLEALRLHAQKRYLVRKKKSVSNHSSTIRTQLKSAVEKGTIKKLKHCERCGSTRTIDGHHEYYSNPFNITWLCRSCHLRRHRGPEKVLEFPIFMKYKNPKWVV